MPEAYMWKGTAYFYISNNYEEAIKSYQLLIKEYMKSEYAVVAQYKIGLCYENLGNNEEAQNAYNKLILLFPEEEKWIKQAEFRLELINK